MKQKINLITLSLCAILLSSNYANAQSWDLSGNSGTTSSNFIGTIDNVSLRVRTKNLTRMIVTGAGNVGIGITAPDARLNLSNTDFTGIAAKGAFQIGQTNNFNLVFDNDNIQARNGGTGSDFYLNYYGGTVHVGNASGYTEVISDIFMNKTAGVSGRLGIKTTSPDYDLHVNSADYTAAYITTPFIGGTAVIVAASAASGNTWGLYASATTSGYAGFFSGSVFCTGSYEPSDARLKENIQPMQNALEKIMKLNVKTYNFKTNEFPKLNLPETIQNGFLAENLETVFPELIKENAAKGEEMPYEFKSVNYTGMIPVLTQAIQEQQKQIADLNAKVKNLETALSQGSAVIPSTEKQSAGNGISAVRLEQNQPNPFSKSSAIRYELPSEQSKGTIMIRDLRGNLVKSIPINHSGKGQVTVNANELTQGTYTYTLEIAGESVDTKLMVITQ